MKWNLIPGGLLALSLIFTSCAPPPARNALTLAFSTQPAATPQAEVIPLPTRPPYYPGQLVEYIAQTGDSLPALAARFNTSEAEIRVANPVIPNDATTMPPGFPMQIPIYYRALWGTPYQILPDSLFVNGPAQVGFNTSEFIASQPGWLKNYIGQLPAGPLTGAEIVNYVAVNFSVSPRLLLAILEYYSGALSDPVAPTSDYVLNYHSPNYRGLYLQLVWAANILNNGYYGWRRGALLEFEHPNGRIIRPDPWQNAASVAIHYFFSRQYSPPLFDQAVGPGGLAETYVRLFGDPWVEPQAHIPGSLRQPELLLPFEGGKTWNYTGGPHTGWGKGEPYAAIDFAPIGVQSCSSTGEWATAMAGGLVARTGEGEVILDLDGDGDERSGWVLYYLHLAAENRARAGQVVQTGDRLGHPSCEGGSSTGTHIHVARKYNGEWILADGPLPFTLEGWVVSAGGAPYKGFLHRYSQTIVASSAAEATSVVRAGER